MEATPKMRRRAMDGDADARHADAWEDAESGKVICSRPKPVFPLLEKIHEKNRNKKKAAKATAYCGCKGRLTQYLGRDVEFMLDVSCSSGR